MTQALERDAAKRRDGLTLSLIGLATFWFVFAAAFGALLVVENKVRVGTHSGASLFGACRVPGASAACPASRCAYAPPSRP